MFGLNGNNEQNEGNQNQSVFGGLVGGLAKNKTQAIKMKILMALLPVLGYILIGLIGLVAILCILSNFNSMFSMISGTDPFITSVKYGTEEGSKPIYDINDSERFPGLENADEIFNSYNEPNTGLNHVKECAEDNSLGMWLSKLFSDEFQEACEMINYIQSKAMCMETRNICDRYPIDDPMKSRCEKSRKYCTESDFINRGKTESDKLYLDRGLLISTFYYSYVWRSKEDEMGELKESDDVLIGSEDPLTIINYMIKDKNNQTRVKVNRDTIDEMYKTQVLPINYLSLSWKPIYSIDVGHLESIEDCEVTDKNDCKKFVHDYYEYYYGCSYEKHGSDGKEFELDLNIYKLFLRDYEKINNEYKLIGKVGTVTASNTKLEQSGSGYIGAKNYQKTVEATDGYCRAGVPSLPEHSYAMSSLSIPEGDRTHIVSKHEDDYVLYTTSQSFINDIESNKKNDYQVFLKHADYLSNDDDNLSFTYMGNNYEVDYSKGFINDKFSYLKRETQKKYMSKRVEQFIDIIFSNAESMNAAMNFPYTSSVDESLATNIAFVIGDEAAPLGDFPWIPSSDFGWRGPIAGTTHTGANYHEGLDMAGAGIVQKAIYAWKPGKVIAAGYDTSCGNFVRIKHESVDGKDVSSLYCHMYTTPKVSVGDEVTAGQQIGIVGSTGNSSAPHLHFTITVNGQNVHPCNYLNVGRTCSEANTNGIIKNWP